MVKSITARFSRPALLLICFALFCCFSGCGGSKDTGTGTGTTTDLSSLTLSVPSSVTYGTPVTVTAILRDTTGALVSGAVVTFAASDTTLAALTPTTALTDSNGTASVTLNAASSFSTGATSITASAPLTSGGTTTTINSAPVGIRVNGTSDLSSLTLSVPSSVTVTPVTATAILKNISGTPVQGAVVSFAASTSGLVVFNSSTALTDVNGTASVTLSAASSTSVGATYITASAQLTWGGITTTITSAPVGITVYAAKVTLGTITLGSPSISAYGTSSISVPVLVNGLPATMPISVTFNSSCVTQTLATITSPVTSNAGTATSTYKDNDCGSGTGITDTITASVTGATVSANITILPDSANNIQFISATPSVMGTSTTGATTLSKSSVAKFQVVDSNNNGVGNVLVDFTLLPAGAPGGITLSATQATSDTHGYVTTAVTAGTVPTPVWVVAKLHSNPAILSESNVLTITTGLPTQNFFSLAVSTHNIEGGEYDGVPTTLTVIASDRLGETVPDGTAINFISEGAHLNSSATNPSTATCTTIQGVCTVTLTSAAYRPIDETINYGGTIGVQGAVAAVDGLGNPITINSGAPLYVKNGRVTVLAYALGEESFVDSNGNNMWDPGETFYDLGDLFLDSNENGNWDSSTSQPNLLEQYISYPQATGTKACGTHIGGGTTITAYPADYASAPSKQNTCDGVWGQNYVRREQTIVLSGSFAQISQYNFVSAGSCFAEYSFWLMDGNYNPMPAGTTVAVDTTLTNVNYVYESTPTPPALPQPVAAAASVSVAGTPVHDTTHAGGTRVSLIINGGTGCIAADSAGTIIEYPYGPVAIDVTTPKGNITTIPIYIE